MVSVVPTRAPRGYVPLTIHRQINSCYSLTNRWGSQRRIPDVTACTKQEDVDSHLGSYAPTSAILDRSRQRVVLTFSPVVFQTGNRYQIEALQLSDIYGAELEDDARTLTVQLPAPTLTETIVYPNPVECNQVTFDKLPIGTHIYIYDVAGNCIASFARTES